MIQVICQALLAIFGVYCFLINWQEADDRPFDRVEARLGRRAVVALGRMAAVIAAAVWFAMMYGAGAFSHLLP